MNLNYKKATLHLLLTASLLLVLLTPQHLFAQADSTKVADSAQNKEAVAAEATEEESSLISPSVEFFTVQKPITL
ncbi:MAG: hypothetical protein IPP48_02185 [Chitinophagaceae bacterium]|nr:hypothetical protein [Chitinophagaceae bacterium]